MKKLQVEQTLDKLKKIIDKKNAEIFRLKEIIDDLPATIYWKDKSGAYLGFNKVGAEDARRLNLPYRAKDILGKTDHDIFPKEMADVFRKHDLEVMQKNQELVREEETLTPSGEKIIQLSTKKPLYDEEGHVVGVVGSTVNITHLKKIEAELRESKEKAEAANKAKTEFLENMRHDIRTPLTGIVGFANLIKEEAKSEKISEYADNLVSSSNALLDFMNSILESIRLNDNENFILRNKFEVKKLLKSIIAINQAKAKEKKLKLELIYDENIPPYLMGDLKKINRIIHELVTNALNFTHKGSVKVFAKLEDEEKTIVKFAVEDTGIGISKEKTNELFSQFSRVHPAYEGNYKGLGLGLSSVKKFVDALGGEVYVKSQLKKGSTFTCILPLKKPLLNDDIGVSDIKNIQTHLKNKKTLSTRQSLAENSSQLPENVPHILLVEDSEVAIRYTKALLKSLGCTVDIAENGKQALSKAKSKRYDFIFMDIGLPDLSGYFVTQAIREFEWPLNRHTPIVALTAHVEKEDKEKCIQFGMDAVLSKPILKDTAEDILNAFIPKRATLNHKNANNFQNNNKESLTLLNISGEVIDKSAKVFNGNIKILKEMLKALIDSFPEEIKALNEAHKKGNWNEIKDFAHKMRGGAIYCGALRLKAACTNLERYLNSGQQKLQERLYQQLLDEIEAVKEEYKNFKV